MPAEINIDPLDTMQELFADALLAPKMTDAALDLFSGPPAQVANRLALYRGNLGEHWQHALSGAYPVLKQQLGDEFFKAMARVYGRRYPSATGDLNCFGGYMPAFLQDFEPTQPYPWLPDLARLEWALHRAHYAADGEIFDAACIATLNPDTMDSVYLRLRPGCSLHHFAWNVETLWQAHQQEPPAEWRDSLQNPVMAFVYREGWRADVRTVDSAEAAAIARLVEGASVGEILDTVLAQDATCDIAALFGRWLADNVLMQTNAGL